MNRTLGTVSLASLAAAPLLPGSFDERIEPTIHLEHMEPEHPGMAGSVAAEAHLPTFNPHIAPQTEEDHLALDSELSLDPEWKQENPPMEEFAPVIDTHEEHPVAVSSEEEPLVASFEDESLDVGEAIESAEEITLEATDVEVEEDLQISLDESEPRPENPPMNDFAARATVKFDPQMFADLSDSEVARSRNHRTAGRCPACGGRFRRHAGRARSGAGKSQRNEAAANKRAPQG